MKSCYWFLTCLLACFVGSIQTQNATHESLTENTLKTGKVFSLFSVVQFKNTGCRSQSAISSGQSSYRNGTCYTSSECSNKGGSASGNCAAGFGVCCLFLISASGSTVSQNCSYIRNPGFPSAYSSTSSVTYTVSKCTPAICYLRLDFESFTLLGPSDSLEVGGGTCPDSFKVTTATGYTIPTVCGLNSGQHMYINMGNQATDSSTLTFSFTGTSTIRNWEIKVTQIECWNPNRPPEGCLQYWTTFTGRITTFNFLSTTTSNLLSQNYGACIKSQAGYCCVEYQVCQSVPNAFSLDAFATVGNVDSYCTADYVIISGSSTTCSTNSGGILNTKYCGGKLNPLSLLAYNVPICDCSAPFSVYFITNARSDDAAGTGDANISRGVCLDYQLLPCTTSS